jgi:hypothetical protein
MVTAFVIIVTVSAWLLWATRDEDAEVRQRREWWEKRR